MLLLCSDTALKWKNFILIADLVRNSKCYFVYETYSSIDQLSTLMLGLADIEASYIIIDNMLNMETRFKVQN